ncbi:type II toxin-antitoxin system antitoxin SocA domain-containing protein [Paenibacillus agricola]|uniref:SocA family protein n=1 Tax=Paenibacillus agricola TaxID=2716264 RepID=A0ABX0JA93_9BACL|nr:type II toxin-antitoxin system antitoxin SocA domain-containing protein [Paenibacillus agricola]NHN32206.1 SocA family protein [Paenibacillus agricola]
MLKRNVLNKLLILNLIEVSGKISGATRLQKLVFLSQTTGTALDQQTFNYKFIKWHYGPYCAEIKEDVKFLEEKRLLNNQGNTLALTKEGEAFLNKARNYTSESEGVLHAVADEYNLMNLDDLLNEVYKKFGIDSDFVKGDTILPVTETSEYV